MNLLRYLIWGPFWCNANFQNHNNIYISRCECLNSSPILVAALWNLVLTTKVTSLAYYVFTGFIFGSVLNFMSFINFRWCLSCKCGIHTTQRFICLRNFKTCFCKGRFRCSFDKWQNCLFCNRWAETFQMNVQSFEFRVDEIFEIVKYFAFSVWQKQNVK